MLNDFWKLNPQATEIETQDNLLILLKNSKHIIDIIYKPDTLRPIDHLQIKIEDRTFENVSFSKTKILNTRFSRCTFKDCLFIGTEFEGCKITNCTFKYVNMSYCTFKDTYIQPDCLKNIFPSHSYSNTAISFYQSIYNNFKNSNQPELLRSAEYYFMKWNLIHTKEKIKRHLKSSDEKKFDSAARLLPRLLSLALQQFFGFGIKLKWYSLTIVSVFLFFCLINYNLWDEFEINPYRSGKHNVIFYTFYSFTSYGSTPMSPTSPLGIFIAMLQGFFGWIFIGVGISMIIKKFLR